MNAGKLLPLVLTLVACSGKPYVVETAPDAGAIRSNKVYVVSHGWHAGLVVPADQINLAVPELKARFGDVAYYEIGWGDKGFYWSKEITTGLTLQAMFWSEGAIIHVVAVPYSPTEYFSQSDVLDTCLTGQEAGSLRTFVANSFAHDSAGHITQLANGIYGNSQFYDGEGRYYLLNTCNKWTAKGLKSAGLGISPMFKLTSGSVMNYLRAHRKECTDAQATGLVDVDVQQSVFGDAPASGGNPEP